VRDLRIAVAGALILAAGACGMRKQPASIASGVPDPGAVSVEIGSLWKEEATKDPVTAYKVRLAGDPHNAALHNNLGNAYVLQNHMDLALEEFRIAARLEPTSPVPWNNIGTTHRQSGRLREARDAFRKALELDPRYALAWYNLGTIHDEQGDYDNAIELYLQALALKPELADSRFNPQAVNNKHLMVIKLRHFLAEEGNLALPLDRLPE
jgi:tetratricopeptide (TPR) repeat protein